MHTKEVWLVTTNTDLIEGRGKQIHLAFCEEYATAKRLAKGQYVQGGNCPMEKCNIFKPEEGAEWFGPISIEQPTSQDIADQSVIDAQSNAVAKAKAAGLNTADIRLIQKAQPL